MTHVGVLVLVAELEAQVVDNVAYVLLDNGAVAQVALGNLTADVLEADDGVGVRGGRETREDALLGQEQGAGADGEESAPGQVKRSESGILNGSSLAQHVPS